MDIAEDPSHFDLPFIPCHTQAVERLIGLVTDISVHYAGGDRFEEEMSNALYSREVMPEFKSKQDYVPHRVRRYSV